MKATSIKFFDDAEFVQVSNLIRDGEFSDHEFHLDTVQHRATLTLWQADEELATTERAGLLSKWRVSPMRRLELSISFVERADFDRRSSGIGNHPLAGIRRGNGHTVAIETYDGITIKLIVSQIGGELLVTEYVDRNRTSRTKVCCLFHKVSRQADS